MSKFGHHLLSKSAPGFERAPFDYFFRPPVLRLSPQPPVCWIDSFIRPVEPPDSKHLYTHLPPPQRVHETKITSSNRPTHKRSLYHYSNHLDDPSTVTTVI